MKVRVWKWCKVVACFDVPELVDMSDEDDLADDYVSMDPWNKLITVPPGWRVRVHP